MIRKIISKIAGFFKEEKPEISGPYAILDWTSEAKKLCVGGSENKEILVLDENDQIMEIWPNLDAVKRWLREERGIPFYPKARGENIPPECVEKRPRTRVIEEFAYGE